MTPKKFLRIGTVSGIVVFLYLGCFGVPKGVTSRAGGCQATYEEYYIAPFIADNATLPYGADIRWARRHNAEVDVLRCLCANQEANQNLIRQYHATNKELWRRVRPEPLESQTDTDAVKVICTEATGYYRVR